MTPIQALLERLPQNVDAAIVTNRFNRRYLTGFPSSAGTLLITRSGCRFLIDSRYREAAEKAIQGCEFVLQEELYPQIAAFFAETGVKRVAIEEEFCTVKTLGRYREKVSGVTWLEDAGLSNLLAQLRQIKTKEELSRMGRAQEITDQAFQQLLKEVKVGMTEREVAAWLEYTGRRLGADGPSFDFIVASGENSSQPHHVPGDRRLASGDLVTIDFGFIVDGYCSDMTRTIGIGQLSDKQRDVYQTVLAAQQAAFAKIKPGVSCREVDKAARDLIDSTPYKGTFGHGLGHSLGQEVHEEPRFNHITQAILEPGMCLSVEPGIYLAGEFGVRIEDIIACTKDGFKNLTKSPKELLILS